MDVDALGGPLLWFEPSEISLPATGSSVTVTAFGRGFAPDLAGVQLTLENREAVSLAAPVCGARIDSGIVAGPALAFGGEAVAMVCAHVGPAPTGSTDGAVMQFTVTRMTPGDVEVRVVVAPQIGTQFMEITPARQVLSEAPAMAGVLRITGMP